MRRFGAALAAGFMLAAMATGASAADGPAAPGGRVDPLGVSGSYECSVGSARRFSFKFVEYKDGLYRIEEVTEAGARRGVARYPWQLATATLARERVAATGATKFRRLNGSLRLLQELRPGQKIEAEYAEASLDGSEAALEWRYEIEVGAPAASFGPSGLGEVVVVPIVERRRRYADARNSPLPLAAASAGFEVAETATVAYAPELGVALRIERRRGDHTIQACSLSAYRRP